MAEHSTIQRGKLRKQNENDSLLFFYNTKINKNNSRTYYFHKVLLWQVTLRLTHISFYFFSCSID